MRVTDGYRNGYLRAVLDIYRVFEKYSSTMIDRKKIDNKGLSFLQKVLDGFLRYRHTIIDAGIDNMDMFLLVNGDIKFKEKK